MERLLKVGCDGKGRGGKGRDGNGRGGKGQVLMSGRLWSV